VALAQHNNFLVIFGRRSILIYQGADTPSSMEIYDAIEGVGCIARDSVQNTGSDVLFLAENGVMSLGRIIQEKSSPMRDISKNVRNDITALIEAETGNVRSAYSAEEAFYLVSFPTRGFVYCFDMRGILEDACHRTTLWDSIAPKCFHVRRNGDLVMGHADGITRYTGYSDNVTAYVMDYYSNPLAFGNATILKFLKKLAFTIIGGSGAIINMHWAFDYKANFASRSYTLASGSVAEYNIAEYNEDEFTAGVIVARPSTNTGGSGYVATIGLTSNINGASVSIQQIDILALLGRLI
jgi:hypothetical protein